MWNEYINTDKTVEKWQKSINQELIQLKKEAAGRIIEKMKEINKDDELLSDSSKRDLIIDYLIDDKEEKFDNVKDIILWIIIQLKSNLIEELKSIREEIQKIDTKERLINFEKEFMEKMNNWWKKQETASTSTETEQTDQNTPKDEETESWKSDNWKESWKENKWKKDEWKDKKDNLWKKNIWKGFDASKIQSNPFEKSPSGITLCSKTARKNGKMFGIQLPSWNGKEAVHKPPKDKEHFITSTSKQKNNNSCINLEKIAPNNANFADLSIESNTKNWRRYGHRAVAFLDESWHRRVLDPYYHSKWKKTNSMSIDEYPKWKNIEYVNFYNTAWQNNLT